MYLWRPVMAKRCTLADLKHLTLDDLADLNELVDLDEALRAKEETASRVR